MPTLRFEGANLKEAVEVARGQVGSKAKIVGATRVRRGGLAGFFARESIEIEVQVTENGTAAEPPAPVQPASHAVRADNGSTGRAAGPGARFEQSARAAGPARRTPGAPDLPSRPRAPEDGRRGLQLEDPLSDLIGEMAQAGPSSVLDLAAKVNDEQGRFVAAGPRQALAVRAAPATPGAKAAPTPIATTLRQVAEAARPQSGSPAASAAAAPTATPAPAKPAALAPTGGPVTAVRRTGPVLPRASQAPNPASPANPDPAAGRATPPGALAAPGFAAVLERIARQEGLLSPGDGQEPLPSPEDRQAPSHLCPELDANPIASQPARWGLLAGEDEPEDHLPGRSRERGVAAPRPASDLEVALQGLGVPRSACLGLVHAPSRESLEAQLVHALRNALPPLPPMPYSPTSLVAVIGPRGEVVEIARDLAADLGAPEEEVALATQRYVWRQKEHVISSPVAAAEERRSWRWRDHPSVVAIEADVRPSCTSWAKAVLRAFEPTICWGVAEASRKPEDVAAWSVALGGLDVLALVDLDGTTSPAAMLGAPVPVGRLDGRPATPEAWAKVLCARLVAG